MYAEWSFQEAKNKFNEVMKAACTGEPQFIIEQGKPIVVVISFEQYEYFQNLDSVKPAFKEMLLAIPQNGDES